MSLESDLLETALQAAQAAAAVHARYVGKVGDDQIVRKGTADFVSHVDLEAQDVAVDIIRARFPGHGILPEEEVPERGEGRRAVAAWGSGSDEFLWIVDPLDGTTNFLHSHPTYAASVGVALGGVPVAGAVVAQATGECWYGARGEGAFRNDRPIRVSGLREISGALVGTGFPFKRLSELSTYLEELGTVLPSCSGIRRGGSASIDLCFLAQGSLDAFWETRLDPWDVAAGLAVLYEAGGVATRRDGSPLDVRVPGSVLAANSTELSMQLLQSLNGAPREEGTPVG